MQIARSSVRPKTVDTLVRMLMIAILAVIHAASGVHAQTLAGIVNPQPGDNISTILTDVTNPSPPHVVSYLINGLCHNADSVKIDVYDSDPAILPATLRTTLTAEVRGSVWQAKWDVGPQNGLTNAWLVVRPSLNNVAGSMVNPLDFTGVNSVRVNLVSNQNIPHGSVNIVNPGLFSSVFIHAANAADTNITLNTQLRSRVPSGSTQTAVRYVFENQNIPYTLSAINELDTVIGSRIPGGYAIANLEGLKTVEFRFLGLTGTNVIQSDIFHRSIIVDNTAPTVGASITSRVVLQTDSTKNLLNVSGTASDFALNHPTSGISRVDVTLTRTSDENGAPVADTPTTTSAVLTYGANPAADVNWSVDLSPAAGGIYSVKVTAVDNAGNLNNPVTRNGILVDRTGPRISTWSLAPANTNASGGTTYAHGTVTFNLAASDLSPNGLSAGAGIASWEIVDNRQTPALVVLHKDGALPVSGAQALDTTLLSNGPHLLALRVTDQQNNVTTTASTIAVTVHNTVPVLSFVKPSTRDTIFDPGQQMSVTANDVGTHLDFKLQATIGTVTTDLFTGSTDTGGQINIPTTANTALTALLPETNFAKSAPTVTLTLTATNVAGVGSTSAFSIQADNAKPAPTLTAPANGSTISGVVTISGTAQVANNAPYLYRVQATDTSSNAVVFEKVVDGQVGTGSAQTITSPWDVTDPRLSNRSYRIDLFIQDKINNKTGTLAAPPTVTVGDSASTSIALARYPDKLIRRNGVTFTLTPGTIPALPARAWDVSVTNKATSVKSSIGSASTPGAIPPSLLWNTAELTGGTAPRFADGAYDVVFVLTDKNGAVFKSNSLSITIDNSKPQVRISSPDNGTVIPVSAITNQTAKVIASINDPMADIMSFAYTFSYKFSTNTTDINSLAKQPSSISIPAPKAVGATYPATLTIDVTAQNLAIDEADGTAATSAPDTRVVTVGDSIPAIQQLFSNADRTVSISPRGRDGNSNPGGSYYVRGTAWISGIVPVPNTADWFLYFNDNLSIHLGEARSLPVYVTAPIDYNPFPTTPGWDTTNGNYPDTPYPTRTDHLQLKAIDTNGVAFNAVPVPVVIDNTVPTSTSIFVPAGSQHIVSPGTDTQYVKGLAAINAAVTEVNPDPTHTALTDSTGASIPGLTFVNYDQVTGGSTTAHFTWNTLGAGVSDGMYTLRTNLSDLAGNVETSHASRVFVVLNKAPIPAITQIDTTMGLSFSGTGLHDGIVVSDTLTVTLCVLDPNNSTKKLPSEYIDTWYLLLDSPDPLVGKKLGSGSLNTGQVVFPSADTISVAVHDVYLTVIDKAGNQSSTKITLNFDNSNPAITINTPSNFDALSGIVNIGATITDSFAKNWSIQIKDPDGTVSYLAQNQSGSSPAFSWPTSGLTKKGPYRITILAVNQANRTAMNYIDVEIGEPAAILTTTRQLVKDNQTAWNGGDATSGISRDTDIGYARVFNPADLMGALSYWSGLQLADNTQGKFTPHLLNPHHFTDPSTDPTAREKMGPTTVGMTTPKVNWAVLNSAFTAPLTDGLHSLQLTALNDNNGKSIDPSGYDTMRVCVDATAPNVTIAAPSNANGIPAVPPASILTLVFRVDKPVNLQQRAPIRRTYRDPAHPTPETLLNAPDVTLVIPEAPDVNIPISKPIASPSTSLYTGQVTITSDVTSRFEGGYTVTWLLPITPTKYAYNRVYTIELRGAQDIVGNQAAVRRVQFRVGAK